MKLKMMDGIRDKATLSEQEISREVRKTLRSGLVAGIVLVG